MGVGGMTGAERLFEFGRADCACWLADPGGGGFARADISGALATETVDAAACLTVGTATAGSAVKTDDAVETMGAGVELLICVFAADLLEGLDVLVPNASQPINPSVARAAIIPPMGMSLLRFTARGWIDAGRLIACVVELIRVASVDA